MEERGIALRWEGRQLGPPLYFVNKNSCLNERVGWSFIFFGKKEARVF